MQLQVLYYEIVSAGNIFRLDSHLSNLAHFDNI